MATVTGYTAARMAAIEAQAIVSGSVSGDILYLTRYNGATFSAGNVRGPQGTAGTNGTNGSNGTQGIQGIPGPAGVGGGKFATGRWYCNPGARTTVAFTSGDVYWIPLVLPEAKTLTNLGVEVTTAGTATSAFLSIYNDLNGLPDSLLYSYGSVSVSTAGSISSGTSSQALAAGNYWICLSIPTSSGGTCTFRAVSESSMIIGGIGNATLSVMTGANPIAAYRAGGQTTSAPTFTAGIGGVAGVSPLVLYKFS